jgi:thiol-disulfide isomerase/thioredoxin
MRSALLVAVSLALAGAPASDRAPAWAPREGRELLGTRAPELRGIEWLQGGPLTLSGLSGKVVLIRFWLTGCAYCEATAPALNELHNAYAAKGLVVVGLHHPKSDETRDRVAVERAARQLGFHFPVGIDADWVTARAYGVGTLFRAFTSVSILVDRVGAIRFVHDGGEFHRGGGPEHRACNLAYDALRAAVEQLLPIAPVPSVSAPR